MVREGGHPEPEVRLVEHDTVVQLPLQRHVRELAAAVQEEQRVRPELHPEHAVHQRRGVRDILFAVLHLLFVFIIAGADARRKWGPAALLPVTVLLHSERDTPKQGGEGADDGAVQEVKLG